MNRRTAAALLATTPLLGSLGNKNIAAASTPTTIRLAELYQIHGAQMFDPLFPNFAKKFGLDVQIVPMRRYPDVQLALATGQVEFGALGFVNIGTMADNNIHNAKVIAGNSSGGQGLILKKGLNAKVKTWNDLQGLKIGYAPGGAAAILIQSILASKGVDTNKITWVSFTGMGPEAIRSLQTGDIDGLLSWEPTNAKAVTAGFAEYSTLRLEESPAGNLNGAFAVNTDFAAKNPQATLDMVRTLVETTNYLNKNHTAWVQLAAAKTGVEPNVVEEALKHLSIYYRIPEAEVQEFMDILSKFHITKKDYRNDVPNYVDYSYLEKATGQTAKALGQVVA